MKNLFLLFIALALFSCSSDDENISTPDDPIESVSEEINILSYEKKMHSVSQDQDSNDYLTHYTGDLNQNKYTSYTREIILNGTSQSTESFEHISYENDQIESSYPMDSNDLLELKQYHYNDDGEIIGASWNRPNRYYRFLRINENTYYFEPLSTFTDEAEAEIYGRRILVFDDHDNVIKAGPDSNLDGVMDNFNQFTYDENNNLIQMELSNGETTSYTYTEIKNTESFVFDQSFGKKIRRLTCAEVYASTDVGSIESLHHSEYITTQESESASFEIHENGFYTKKTWEPEPNNTNYTSQYSLTYFFE